MAFDNILCVCTGNICRSPLAQGLLQRALPHATVSSAGIAAVEGGPMPQEAAVIAERDGLPLANHRGRQITTPMANDAHLIIVMEKRQRDWLCNRFPQTRGRVLLLSHWSDGDDVADPFKKSQAFFDEIYDEIVCHTKAWIENLAVMV